jgi:predicted DNA-binding transcriptional regulator AlpA
MTSACDIAKALRDALEKGTNLSLGPNLIEQIIYHLEGKSRKMSLDEIQNWMQQKESQRDPIFIQNTESKSGFWMLSDAEIDDLDFPHHVMMGVWVAWTGRPTENQIKEARSEVKLT